MRNIRRIKLRKAKHPKHKKVVGKKVATTHHAMSHHQAMAHHGRIGGIGIRAMRKKQRRAGGYSGYTGEL